MIFRIFYVRQFVTLLMLLLALGLIGTGFIATSHAETTLAIFGDFGAGGVAATQVSEMIRDQGNPSNPWSTDYVFTTGDNQYGQIDVGHNHWDRHIGQLYGSYMKARLNPTGIYQNQTSNVQRFFPAVGNHDASPTGTGQTGDDGGIIPGYLDFFHDDPGSSTGRLPSGTHNLQESYYDVELPIEGGAGTIQMFVMDSNSFRVNPTSRAAQTAWLENGLKNSTATWKFVTVHHPAYNSTARGDDYQMQLPFQQWGAHAIFAGHSHTYERIHVTDAIQKDMPYFVTGLGGLSGPHGFLATSAGSRRQFGGDLASNGSMRVTISDETAQFEFLSIEDGAVGANGGRVIDSMTLHQNSLPQAPTGNRLVRPGAAWQYLDDGSNQGTAWREFGFDANAAGWNTGQAQLGYGNLFETTTVASGVNPKPVTTYYRHEFHVTADELDRFEKLTLGLVRDDGAAVYLNGVAIRRDKLTPNAAFNQHATGVTGSSSEYIKFSTDLAAGNLLRLGKNVLAVEVHQASLDDQDLAFDLSLDGGRMEYGNATPGVSTSFEESGLGNVAFGRDPSSTELAWGQQFFGFSGYSEIRDSINAIPLGDQQFVVNNRSIKLISEPIDVRNFRDVQVSIDLRAFTASTSGFELGDRISLGVQTSLDGITFTDTTWDSIVGGQGLLLTGQAVGTEAGTFQSSESPLGFIGEDVKSIKVFIRATNNSDTEYMFFDNIEISGISTSDFNSDGLVNATDLAILKTHFGNSAGASFLTGDTDRDGDVDGHDFLNWQRHHGNQLPSTSSSLTVPEPSTVWLIVSCAVFAIFLRRSPQGLGRPLLR